MGEAEKKLKDEIDALLKRAEDEDAAEDEKFGKGRSGDDLPQSPDATVERNFTDAESRIMPSGSQRRDPRRQVFVAGAPSCRATTRRSRWMGRRRSSWPWT
jgi:hypothetical protein